MDYSRSKFYSTGPGPSKHVQFLYSIEQAYWWSTLVMASEAIVINNTGVIYHSAYFL